MLMGLSSAAYLGMGYLGEAMKLMVMEGRSAVTLLGNL
jgi:hypothetical protein